MRRRRTDPRDISGPTAPQAPQRPLGEHRKAHNDHRGRLAAAAAPERSFTRSASVARLQYSQHRRDRRVVAQAWRGRRTMVGQVTVAPEAMARLRSDEVLVFDWVHIAICCAGAGEVSLHSVPARRVAGSSAYVSMPSDPPGRVYAHRIAYPHLAGRDTLVGVRGRR